MGCVNAIPSKMTFEQKLEGGEIKMKVVDIHVSGEEYSRERV